MENTEKRLDDRRVELEDLVLAAELFDDSLKTLEDWKPKTAVLEEPISITKEGTVEQVKDLMVS